jgi:Flp pilus assembly pilin Flp
MGSLMTPHIQRKSARARFAGAARGFVSDRAGAIAMEYILIGAILGAAVAAAVSVLRGSVSELYAGLAALFGS